MRFLISFLFSLMPLFSEAIIYDTAHTTGKMLEAFTEETPHFKPVGKVQMKVTVKYEMPEGSTESNFKAEACGTLVKRNPEEKIGDGRHVLTAKHVMEIDIDQEREVIESNRPEGCTTYNITSRVYSFVLDGQEYGITSFSTAHAYGSIAQLAHSIPDVIPSSIGSLSKEALIQKLTNNLAEGPLKEARAEAMAAPNYTKDAFPYTLSTVGFGQHAAAKFPLRNTMPNGSLYPKRFNTQESGDASSADTQEEAGAAKADSTSMPPEQGVKIGGTLDYQADKHAHPLFDGLSLMALMSGTSQQRDTAQQLSFRTIMNPESGMMLSPLAYDFFIAHPELCHGIDYPSLNVSGTVGDSGAPLFLTTPKGNTYVVGFAEAGDQLLPEDVPTTPGARERLTQSFVLLNGDMTGYWEFPKL